MRNLKKLASIVLAAVMTLALAVPAFATQEPTTPEFKITVTNPQVGSTYNFYRIFDMTTTGSGTDAKYSYSATSKWAPFFADDAPGAAFLTTEANDYLISVNKENKYLDLDTETKVANFANAARAYALENKIAPDADGSVATEGAELTKTFGSAGYYMIFAVDASQNIESTASMCILSNTNPEQDVKIKSEKPSIDKTADEGKEAVVKGVGDTVTFTVKGNVPDTTGYNTYTYKISDTMSKGLTFNNDVAVTIDNAPVDITGKITYADNGFVLTLDKDALGTNIGADIVVTYTAEVNANAIVSESEQNAAKLEYSNDPDDSTSFGKTVDSVVTVYDVQIDVDKYALDAENKENKNNKLAGAQFALKNSENKYYKYTPAADGTAAALEWVENVNEATVYITNSNGKLAVMTDAGVASETEMCFKGLSPNTEYTLEEIEAPAGYNKAADIPVTVAPATDTKNTDDGTWVKVSETTDGNTTTITWLNTVSLNHVESVQNSTGAELPETGGMGTTLFYALGGLLVVGAGILLITKKRMGAE